MPIYEYKCDKGHVFDTIQKFSDDPLTECLECGAPATRVLTPPAIHFKGSGFHNTDYGTRKGGATSDSNGGSGDSKPDGGGDSKSSGDSSSSNSDTKPKAGAASD